jgi:hypothetical protein
MSIGVSPRLLPRSFKSLPGLISETLVAPPAGAVRFRYFATVALFSGQPEPWGARNVPLAVS